MDCVILDASPLRPVGILIGDLRSSPSLGLETGESNRRLAKIKKTFWYFQQIGHFSAYSAVIKNGR